MAHDHPGLSLCGIFAFLLRYDAYLCGVQEFDDIANLLSVGHLVTNLQSCIEDAYLAIEDEAVGVGDVFADVLVDFPGFHHRVVGPFIIDWVTACDDVGRYILGEACTSLQHSQIADTCAGILYDRR